MDGENAAPRPGKSAPAAKRRWVDNWTAVRVHLAVVVDKGLVKRW